MKRVLILGGTGEAVAFARAASAEFGPSVDLVTSLAGRTKAPTRPQGAVRVGGFDGVSGLADYLSTEEIDIVIDATHPFAAKMTANAVAACDLTHKPRLRLDRPAWTAVPGDDWHAVSTVAEAAVHLPEIGSRAFLTLGSSDLAAFKTVPGMPLWARMIEAPEPGDVPPQCTVIRARGPFAENDEVTLLRAHRIDVLVTKNSGGDAAAAKLSACRSLGIPVVMVARPPDPPGDRVPDVAAALNWLRPRLLLTISS